MGKPTKVNLTSKDVIHSFFISSFRIKKDAMPGMRTQIWFEPTMEGKFEITCAQLCGVSHTSMRGDVVAESQEKFDAFVNVERGWVGNQ